jgi:uncharacterized protein (UPF0332 family)
MSRLSSDLLKQARSLASQDPNRSKDASVRRAISTAYYALFHFLIDEATRILIGTSLKDKPLRQLLSRCFQHQSMAKACKQIVDLANNRTNPASAYGSFAPSLLKHAKDLQVVAKTFTDRQGHRHLADYDLGTNHSRADALISVREVEEAMRAWNRIKKADRRLVQLMAVMLLHNLQLRS